MKSGGCAAGRPGLRIREIRAQNVEAIPGLRKRNPGHELHGLQIFSGRLASLAVHHDFEGNALTLPQLAEAGAFDGTDMDEYVLTTALGLNETITLLRVEPFHGTVVHGYLLIDVST
jgi:hypothetical protein